jgi:tetratricopeptide (TPR) repeat protein
VVVAPAQQQAFAAALADLQAGHHARAAQAFEALAAANPALAAPHFNRGLALEALERDTEARAAYEAALALDPGLAEAQLQLGLMHRRAGEFEQARLRYEAAIKARADYAPAHRNLGILCDIYLRDYACALRHYERYQALGGQPEKEVTAWIIDLKRRM